MSEEIDTLQMHALYEHLIATRHKRDVHDHLSVDELRTAYLVRHDVLLTECEVAIFLLSQDPDEWQYAF